MKKKKNRFTKVMAARKRKLNIINYRAEKISRKLIKAANARSDESVQYHLKMEAEREASFKKSMESIQKMKDASKRRNNQVVRGTIKKCRELMVTAHEIFKTARTVINESESKAEDINELHKELDKLKIKLSKPEGAIGDNKLKADRGIKDITHFNAQLDKLSRQTMMNDIVQ